MDAQTFHDLNVTIQKLHTAIQGEMYRGERHGMVPPEAIPGTIQMVEDALATMTALTTRTMVLNVRIGGAR